MLKCDEIEQTTMIKVIRTATIAESLANFLKGQLKFLSQHFDVLGVSSEGEELESIRRNEEIPTISIEMARNISVFQDLVSLYRLCVLFRKEKPTIVHSITPKAGLLTMLAGKMMGVPIRIHTFTGLIFPTKTGLIQKILIKTDQLLCWSATNIYPEGEGVKADLIKYNITSKPLNVIANGNVNGINLNHFDSTPYSIDDNKKFRTKLGIEDDDFVFIFVGRIVGDKGINELVQAFDRLSKDRNNVKLLLVGRLESELDPLETRTLDVMAENPNIIATGQQPDVRPYFAISNALAFPSYREGFPNVVLQAGAMNLPSIVSNISGCNEIISDGVNGRVIPSKDADALFAAMSELYLDPQLCLAIAKKTRNIIAERYDQSLVWAETLKEYERLLSKQNN